GPCRATADRPQSVREPEAAGEPKGLSALGAYRLAAMPFWVRAQARRASQQIWNLVDPFPWQHAFYNFNTFIAPWPPALPALAHPHVRHRAPTVTTQPGGDTAGLTSEHGSRLHRP